MAKYGETWLYSTNKYNILFEFLKSLFKSLKLFSGDHCIFIVASLTFQQNITILIGSDPAPFMTTCFFSHLNLRLSRRRRSNLQKARKFAKTFLFIDR